MFFGNARVMLFTSDSSSAPTGHAETRFTLEDGTVETYNIEGTLDSETLCYYGYVPWDEESPKIIIADIGNTVTNFALGTFNYHSALTTVIIPSSITSIENNIVEIRCDSLTTIRVLGRTTAEAKALLTNAAVPAGCTIVGELG